MHGFRQSRPNQQNKLCILNVKVQSEFHLLHDNLSTPLSKWIPISATPLHQLFYVFQCFILRSIRIRVWTAVGQPEALLKGQEELVCSDMDIKVSFKQEDQSARGKGTQYYDAVSSKQRAGIGSENWESWKQVRGLYHGNTGAPGKGKGSANFTGSQ